MLKKTLYICGDSFCADDLEYGDNWHNLLVKQVANIDVVNLSIPGASNYLIYLQVKQALENDCDYLIYNATGSTRQEFTLCSTGMPPDNIDRYYNVLTPTKDKELLCLSWIQPFELENHSSIPVSFDTDEIKRFFMKYIDMSSVIEKNYIFIQQTLFMISSSKNILNWAWSQGGFEHKKFKSVRDWNFSEYRKNECSINLWDYYDSKVRRPHYHITDKQILQDTCNQYIKMLQL